MMELPLLLFLLQSQPQPQQDRAAQLIEQIRLSGQLVELAQPSSERLAPPKGIPPGAPPILTFRYLEGRDRHRFGKLDLIVDDAGH